MTKPYRVVPYPEVRSAPLLASGVIHAATLHLAPNPSEFPFTPLISPTLIPADPTAGLQGLQTFSAPIQVQHVARVALPRIGPVSYPQIVSTSDFNSSVSCVPISFSSTPPQLALASLVGSGTSVSSSTVKNSASHHLTSVSISILKENSISISSAPTPGLVYLIMSLFRGGSVQNDCNIS